MIFVINNLKYDTDKMELISDECEYWYKGELLGTPMRYRGREKSVKFQILGKYMALLNTLKCVQIS